jgi:hypothetical protein
VTNLPTRDGMFFNANFELGVAYRALGDAVDWLRSDWQPVDTPLTKEQSKARSEMFDLIAEAKGLVNKARDSAYRGMEER